MYKLTIEDIQDSEKQLRACESWQPEHLQAETAMVLFSKYFKPFKNLTLSLLPVTTPEHWQILFQVRQKIEVPFGLTDRDQIQTLIKDIQNKQITLGGQWYLAKHKQQWVGSIGTVPFQKNNTHWTRLQDVDIVPEHQNKGLGRQLLSEVCQKCFAENAVAIGLNVVSDSWVQAWYARAGFITLS